MFCQTFFKIRYLFCNFFFSLRVLQKNSREKYKWGVSFYKFLCKQLNSENPDRAICHCARLCTKAAKFRPYYNLIKINCDEYKEIIEKQRRESLEINHICHLEVLSARVGGFMSLK